MAHTDAFVYDRPSEFPQEAMVRLGIGLPTYQGNTLLPDTVMEFARRAEGFGFDAVAVHDRPNHETWEPLIALAAVSQVTTRVRLATAAIILPTREESFLVKQAALVDRMSGGRLDLGLAVGGRQDDFDALNRKFSGRGATFERQLARLDELWSAAATSVDLPASPGPAPTQLPRPRTWVGGYAPAAIERSVQYADGYLFGAATIDVMRTRIPEVRRAAADVGKAAFQIGGVAYVVPSDDAEILRQAEAILLRYYGRLSRPFEELVLAGNTEVLADAISAYRLTGLDVLHLVPLGGDPRMVDQLAPLIELAGQ